MDQLLPEGVPTHIVAQQPIVMQPQPVLGFVEETRSGTLVTIAPSIGVNNVTYSSANVLINTQNFSPTPPPDGT